jgi:membrane-bound lytic murein transglycosylase B
VLAAVLAAAVLGVGVASASARAGAAARLAIRPAPVAAVPPEAGTVLPGIDARLLGLPLLPAAGDDASGALAEAQAAALALRRERATLETRAADLAAATLRLTAAGQRQAAALALAQRRFDELAAAAYRGGADAGGVLKTIDASSFLEADRRQRMVATVEERLRSATRRAVAARRAADARSAAVADESAAVSARLAAIAGELPAAQRAVVARTAQARTDLPARKVAGIGIPVVALDAYLRAERTMGLLAPGCGIGWWLVAGIADGESGHGTSGGARADAAGTVFPAIVGIPLDGTHATQPVPDSDGGLLDGDPIWDRAVGPLQFTPSTWHAWASDGNADGMRDPQNLYDAALAAARKLCADAGPDGLHTDAQIARALKPYVVTDALVRAKLARARDYEAQGLPAPDPAVVPPAG